jgi:hypothetical protein
LNPYTKFGPLAYFFLPLLVLPFVDRLRVIGGDTLFFSFVMVFLSLIGVFSSFVHGIEQFIQFKVAISIFIYILMAYAVFMLAKRAALNFNDLVYQCLLVVIFNSSIIIIQVLLPGFRDFTESFLVLSGNVDWTEGFRYRGVASGGGASLSVLVPVAVVLALHLYYERKIGVFVFFVMASVLIVSLFFIGRTGFLLMPFVFLFFVFFNMKKYFFNVFFLFSFLASFVFIFGGEIKEFVISKYGVEFYNYSFGFFLGGVDGLKEEGTVSIIIDFLKVMPTTFPEVLIGYGFYGGSDFYPWTDSGYSRMFLSIGYLFGFLFYLCFFLMFRSVIFKVRFVFITIGFILLVAEAKEPLLFTGYASRVYIILLAFSKFSIRYDKYKANQLNCFKDKPVVKAA